MGGQANTDGWGRSNWGQADYGDTNVVISGWGRLGWDVGRVRFINSRIKTWLGYS